MPLIGLAGLDGAKIRELRDRLGLTQAAFGHLVGRVPNTTVSRWETGAHQPSRPCRRKLLLLAKKAGIDLYRRD